MMDEKRAVNKKFKEIPFGRPWIEQTDKDMVLDVLNGHILTHGPKCKEFEELFIGFVGDGYSVTTSSCMPSLHLGAIKFDLSEGDEVIVPSQTHVATVHAVEIMGAKPIFVDCELNTGNLDLGSIESKITQKTKAIFVVHFVGIPTDMRKVCKIAEKYNLKVLEDCALAVGSRIEGKHVGLWGDVGTFSFYPVKHITTGEGGMFISKSAELVNWCSNYRAFSVDRSYSKRLMPGVYDVLDVGLNYRMSELQAALGCSQIKKLDLILDKRKRNFMKLSSLIKNIDEILVLHSNDKDLQSSFYCLVIILQGRLKNKRDFISLALKDKKIGTSVYYPKPVPYMSYYKKKYGTPESDFENALYISNNSIALPVGPHLSEEDIDYIYNALCEIIKGSTK